MHVCTIRHTASDHVHLQLQCHDETSWDDVTWNTDDIISWCGHGIIGLAYKRHCTVPIGVHLVLHILLYTLGTCACLHWCTDAPMFLEPTSFKRIWLGCYYCEHLWCINAFTHFRNISWDVALPSSWSISTGPSYLWLVPMSTVFVVEGLHHWKCITAGSVPCCPA